MENYFIISNGDGDTTVEQVSREELLKRIEEKSYGDVKCLENIPTNGDTNYWGEDILIIKGKIVTPEPETIVTKFKVE